MTQAYNNRLTRELSPYLLQHAHNPVDWYPWGEEAFIRARIEQKPIFLSIGYAACHWCHVMEEQCFMDEEVAELINRFFIPIKVDREERPDIDRIYMSFCQLMTGSGGWPLSLFLTPEHKPFYAATYIPKHTRQNIPGMLDLIPYLAGIWEKRRDELFKSASEIFDAITEQSSRRSEGVTESASYQVQIHEAYQILAASFDSEHAGFGHHQKFPSIPQITYLLTYANIINKKQAEEMAIKTLFAMAYGGIRDHIGTGFHRYTIDRAWKIPHFEKMLPDQALNALAFTQAWQITRSPVFKKAAYDCMEYICTFLKQPGGGFRSSEDADSSEGEGAFYLWQAQEIREVLSPDDYQFASQIWGFKEDGNIPAGVGMRPGSNVIALKNTIQATDKETEDNEQGTIQRIDMIRSTLFQVRSRRQHPAMDDTILTDWNGITLRALALMSGIYDYPSARICAVESADYLIQAMILKDGTVLHRLRNELAGIEGTAQDYIFLASGLLSLFQLTGIPRYLKVAINLEQKANNLFWDRNKGGYFATREGDPLVPVQLRDEYDGPIPSVNGAAFQLLITLGMVTGRNDFTDRAEQLAMSMNSAIIRSPSGTLTLLEGILIHEHGIRAVITGREEDPLRREIWSILTRDHLPGLTVIPHIPEYMDELATIIRNLETRNTETPAVFFCTRGICHPPIGEPQKVRKFLENIRRS
ncbi:MAG TPA: thioredoxin domain-containing protein [Methanospirillum sp.]|nr:thioredoxin domain-containing protein [Methanospirillum sp.]